MNLYQSMNVTIDDNILFSLVNMNASSCGHNQPYPVPQAILRVYFMVPTILIGLISNGLSIAVFYEQSMRKSFINWFLLALAISDQLILISSLCMLSLPVIAEYYLNMTLIEITTHLTRWVYPLSQSAQTCSVYLTVMVSFYRYVGVCHPFRAKRSSSTPKLYAIFAVIISSLSFNIPRWIEVSTIECFSETFNRRSIVLITTPFSHSVLYTALYRVWGYFIIMFLIPFAILMVINICITRSLHKASKTRTVMSSSDNNVQPRQRYASMETIKSAKRDALKQIPRSNENVSHVEETSNSNMLTPVWTKQESNDTSAHMNSSQSVGHIPHFRSSLISLSPTKQHCGGSETREDSSSTRGPLIPKVKPENGVTLMLMALVATFLVCNTLPLINNCIEIAGTYGHIWINPSSFLILVELGNLLVTMTGPANTVIYVIFSTKYRLAAIKLIHCLCPFNKAKPVFVMNKVRVSIREAATTSDRVEL